MNRELVDRVAAAVLYEGYLLYPYRPSSVKNRQRWTFGGLYPPAYAAAQLGADSAEMRVECVVAGPAPRVDVRVRFLRLQERSVWKTTGAGLEPAAELVVGGRAIRGWQEAAEAEAAAADLGVAELVERPHTLRIALPAGRDEEAVPGGAIVRERRAVEAAIEISARPAGAGFVLTVRVANETPFAGGTRDDALARALVSTHVILHARGGEFVSLLDPPAEWAGAAAGCRNAGAFPVLVGEPGDRDTLLASPIILYDYPQIAPESPGDLFDATEIDEILTLRILTLTDAERREMIAADDRGRALLERTDALDGEQLMRLHGTLRGLRHLGEGTP